jgi:hypothetical protein
MSRREWIATAVGSIAGGLLSAGTATLREPNAGLWLAAAVGAVFGLAGGALGQDFIEGCVVAGMCLILAACIVSLPIPWPWLRELGVGWCVGTGVGCFAHGSLA